MRENETGEPEKEERVGGGRGGKVGGGGRLGEERKS